MNRIMQLLVVASVMVFFIAGCGPVVSYNLQPGYTDTISYTKHTTNRVWVEMKDKEPSETGRKNIDLEYNVTREIQSVESDGSLKVKLTFNKLSLEMVNVGGGKEKKNYYISESGNTKSSWRGEPSVAGKSVTVKMLNDSSIVFEDLAELRTSLKLTDGDNSTVAALISEKELKKVLERPFLVNCPKGNIAAKSWDSIEPIPDSMLNTKALRMIYSSAGENAEGDYVFNTDIEPLYTLPEGMEEAPAGDPFRQILKDRSDLQEPEVESEAVLDPETGLVTKDMLNVTYLMIVDGNKLFPDQQKNSKADAGMMYIEIKINEDYEIK